MFEFNKNLIINKIMYTRDGIRGILASLLKKRLIYQLVNTRLLQSEFTQTSVISLRLRLLVFCFLVTMTADF